MMAYVLRKQAIDDVTLIQLIKGRKRTKTEII